MSAALLGPVDDLFAGPGGWDQGARVLGLHAQVVGFELNADAAATATGAGHARMVGDVLALDPTTRRGVRGVIVSSPCPTFSRSGKGTGRADMQVLLDVITHAGQGCGCTWAQIAVELDECADPRTALAAQCIRWALLLPDVEWVVFEQVPAAEHMFEEIAAELLSFDDGTREGGFGPGFEDADVFTVDAQHFGMPVRRLRSYLVARRYAPLGGRDVPSPALPPRWVAPSMAAVLGWPDGHRMRTRGNRRATGGNFFGCDGPSWCLTEKARTWEREADGLRLTSAQAGLLNGFPLDYPWTGSRTAQFHQAGDVVVPPVAAAVLGYATGTPWVEPVRAYLRELYGHALAAPLAAVA